MSGNISYVYDFAFPDGKRTRFSVELEADTLTLIPEPQHEYPEWAALGSNKCSGCMLDERLEPLCPVAVSIVHPVEVFNGQDQRTYLRTFERNPLHCLDDAFSPGLRTHRYLIDTTVLDR